MEVFTIDKFIEWIKNYCPSIDIVTENILLENDLGITGDDGVELLEVIEKPI